MISWWSWQTFSRSLIILSMVGAQDRGPLEFLSTGRAQQAEDHDQGSLSTTLDRQSLSLSRCWSPNGSIPWWCSMMFKYIVSSSERPITYGRIWMCMIFCCTPFRRTCKSICQGYEQFVLHGWLLRAIELDRMSRKQQRLCRVTQMTQWNMGPKNVRIWPELITKF